MRFLFNRPLAWSDELIVILYILMVFWSAATLLKERDHVMLDLVYEALPPAGQRVFALAGAGLTAALLLVLLPQASRLRALHAPREARRCSTCPSRSCSRRSCCSSR